MDTLLNTVQMKSKEKIIRHMNYYHTRSFLEIHTIILAALKIFIWYKQDIEMQYLFPSKVATIHRVISKQSRIKRFILYIDISSPVK